MFASAQSYIDFTNLPATGNLYAIPETYGGLHWAGIDYVSCMLWDYTDGVIEMGQGFMAGPEYAACFRWRSIVLPDTVAARTSTFAKAEPLLLALDRMR